MTCTISDKWRSSHTEKGQDFGIACPVVSQFEIQREDSQPEIREQSMVVLEPILVSREHTPKSKSSFQRTPFKTVRESGIKDETEEEKLVSLCLMAMNLEALTEDDQEVHNRKVIPPIEMTLLNCEQAAKRFLKSMDLEEIGSLTIDFSQERPKVMVKDTSAGISHSGWLQAGEPTGSKRELIKLQQTVENMTKVIQMLTSQIGVLEERVRYVEGCDTITMKE